MQQDRIKLIFTILSVAAVGLGIIATFIVFFPTGSFQPVVVRPAPGTSQNQASSTVATSTSTSTATSTVTGGGPSQFSSEFIFPYPVAWRDGTDDFAITGANLQGNKLTLTLSIKMGASTECVPVNIRLVKDESGSLQAPDVLQFVFPDTGGCEGRPNQTYSQSVAFTVDTAYTPFLLTTGGSTNAFFTVETTTAGGLNVSLPSRSG